MPVIGTPRRCESSISATIPLIIGRSIVNTIFGTEIKSFKQGRKIDIKTRIELELAAHKLIVAGRVCISHRISGILLRTTKEVLAILDIITVKHSAQGILVCILNITQRNKRRHQMRTQRSSLPPPVYISRIRIIKCHISISLRGDKFMQLHIHISTDKETADVVIFRITHFKKRRFAIVTGRSIIFHFLATARNFGNRFRTVVCLP